MGIIFILASGQAIRYAGPRPLWWAQGASPPPAEGWYLSPASPSAPAASDRPIRHLLSNTSGSATDRIQTCAKDIPGCHGVATVNMATESCTNPE